MTKWGSYAFVVGLVIAFLASFLDVAWIAWVLVVLGLLVGFLNITREETQGFLLAAIGLMLAATSVQVLPYVGDLVTQILANLVTFIAPAVLVVAIIWLFHAARD
jgi:hypothetical protein